MVFCRTDHISRSGHHSDSPVSRLFRLGNARTFSQQGCGDSCRRSLPRCLISSLTTASSVNQLAVLMIYSICAHLVGPGRGGHSGVSVQSVARLCVSGQALFSARVTPPLDFRLVSLDTWQEKLSKLTSGLNGKSRGQHEEFLSLEAMDGALREDSTLLWLHEHENIMAKGVRTRLLKSTCSGEFLGSALTVE